MKPTMQWEGNVDIESGIATYQVNGIEYSLYFATFREAKHIADMLEEAYTAGKKDAYKFIKEGVHGALDGMEIYHL